MEHSRPIYNTNKAAIPIKTENAVILGPQKATPLVSGKLDSMSVSGSREGGGRLNVLASSKTGAEVVGSGVSEAVIGFRVETKGARVGAIIDAMVGTTGGGVRVTGAGVELIG